MKKPHRRYDHDMLLYESFYVAIVNSLLVSFTPPFVFLLLMAIEDAPMTKAFVMTVLSLMEVTFMIAFLINFLYYTILIRARRAIAYVLAIVISCALAFVLLISDIPQALNDLHTTTILVAWFMLLALIILANKTGWLALPDSKYDRETWLYKHELAERGEDGEHKNDLDRDYIHRYIDHRDEDAPDQVGKPIDPDQDPKRAARYDLGP